ncbi:MAG TPA: choice-of-anchor L domain-containing protein, partial [Flavobacterium sp.]|nr:choice-of-anchor L domain-containing protein [Flavobacterium sp.]
VGTIYPVSAAQVGAPPGPYTFNIAGLTQATIYYYYIRTVCPGDDKSTWAGPVIFNTITCDAADKCTYKFVLTDLGSNGWNGARLQVRQNGIPITPIIGGTINGAGPTTVNISLCDDIPFDVFWQTAGTAPDEIGFTVQNPFTDIIYTYEPGTGTPGTVIWNSVTECDPPTCPKPTALNVNIAATTQTTVELTWTPGGSETQWEVYVVPVGGALPVNGQPLADPTNTTDNYYVANAPLPFTVTGLLPGTNYIYYVRAICSDSDVSTWTILNPKTFTTKPVNDECTAAINVPVNPTRECVDDVSGSTVGATLSSQLAGCPGQEDDDVWYMFTATNEIHIITLSNVVGGGGDVNHTVYALAGPDCSTMTQLYCSNPNVSIANALTPNNVYYIRVYSNGNTQTNALTFDLCITTPPDVTNDNCGTATVAVVNDGLECVQSTPGWVLGATASPQPGNTCAGTEDDDVWFQFTANSVSQIISLINITGTDTDLNFSVYSGNADCSTLTFLECSTENELIIEGLTVNNTYYIRVYSATNTLQDILFDLCIGKILPPIITSTTQYTITELVTDVFIDSDCALVSNITSSNTNGIGYFNKGESEFTLDEGIVLSTGNANLAPGPNLDIQSNSNAGGSDADLQAFLNDIGAGGTVNDATKLEFDFIPLTNYIEFDFIFASEEYGNFQCGFSDFFAFLLTDTTTNTTTNLAVVPGTTDPVCVFTVRDQQFNAGCNSVNPEYFGSFYGAGGINPLGAPINFNGVTLPMVAASTVTPGVTYHIKLVVGDHNDTAFDSAVFIQDFKIGDVDLGVDLTVDNGNAICVGDEYTIQSGLDPALYTFEWYNGTDLIADQTGPNLTVTQPGAYTIKAQFNSSSCQATDTVTIEYYQDELPGTPDNLINCDASGSALFDLTENTDNIMAPFAPGTHTIAYFLNADDANGNVNDIDDPAAFTGNNDQVIWVRIDNIATGCKQLTSFTLTVQDLTPQFTVEGKLAICPDESTTLTVQPVAGNFDPTLVTYVWTGPSGTLPDTGQSITVVGASGYGSYSVLVNNQGCTATQAFDVIENPEEWTVSVNAPATLCPSESATILVNIGNNTNGDPVQYTYTTPGGTPVVSNSNSFVITGPGNYNVNVNILGCDTDYPFTVGTSTPAWAVSVTGNTPLCPDETGTVTATVTNPPAGATITYTFTRPSGGDVTNTTGVLPVDEAGDYTVSVDIYGCPSAPQPFAIAEGAIDYTVSFVGEPYTICDNQSVLVSFTANNFDINDPLVSFTWIRPDGTTATGATISADQVGTYQLTVERLGCQAGPFPVNVGENNTTVTIGSDNSCENNVFLIRAIPVNNSFDPATATFEWTGTAPFQPGTEPWIIRVTEGGTYTVTVTTPDGCKSIQPITENFIACGIQRGISPNGDGKNDTFDLSGYNVSKLTIFNRYGTQVYEYANYTNQWGGQSAGGETLPSATYFYVIETAEGDQLTGWIYINR